MPAGHEVTASDLAAILDRIEFGRRFVRKTADETVSASTTLQNDDHLLASLAANKTYSFMFVLYYSSGTTPDLKVAMTFPTGAVCAWAPTGYTTGGTSGESQQTATAWQAASGTSQSVGGGSDYPTLKIQGTVRTSSTTGNLQLQWAQATSSGSSTVKADSYLMIWDETG